MRDRWDLIQRGLFPETLPPAFTAVDLKRAFGGIVRDLTGKALHRRPTDYVRYSGTKHDGSRRYFGTPNPVSYFHVATFVAAHWPEFEARFDATPFSVSRPRVAAQVDDRPIIIPSLSQLTTVASKKIGYSPVLLKTDIAQFFPSIYTHSIPWSAHGIDAAKADTSYRSTALPFNALDFFVRNCQLGETRGVLVGPDAFRLIAEYIVCGLDTELQQSVGNHIVGTARHVDDYYIGLRSEPEALAVLSRLREILQRYSLNINDAKTKVMSGLEPLNDLWAQELRHEATQLNWAHAERVILLLNKGLALAAQLKTDSPVKIALRTFDTIRLYRGENWSNVEPYLQRVMFHHPHCIDYVALLVTKRVAIGEVIDVEGWREVAFFLLRRHLERNHHHEIVWLVWLLLSCDIELSDQLIDALSENSNAHVRALLVGAYSEGRIARAPPLRFDHRLGTTNEHWLTYLVARSTQFTRAAFSGVLADEFEHLAGKGVRLLNFKAHLQATRKANTRAISRTRYGYDNDDDDDDDFLWRLHERHPAFDDEDGGRIIV